MAEWLDSTSPNNTKKGLFIGYSYDTNGNYFDTNGNMAHQM
jgi:hypothetical protein